MTRIAIALAIAFLSITYISPESLPFYAQREPTLQEYVCDKLGDLYPDVDCSDVAPPTVVISRIVEIARAYGVYIPGESVIFVGPDSPHQLQTIIHEWTHYIVDQLSLTEDRCEHELAARYVAGQDTEEWRTRYGCENPDAQQE